jgi:hypothetical protein
MTYQAGSIYSTLALAQHGCARIAIRQSKTNVLIGYYPLHNWLEASIDYLGLSPPQISERPIVVGSATA